MTLSVQCERDEDGRWLAKMPGAIAYGETIEEAMAKVEALTLQVAAEQVKLGEAGPIDSTDTAAKSDHFGDRGQVT
jgi:predicted RNase H-like HicB family nuclease